MGKPVEELKALLEKATPGPWKEAGQSYLHVDAALDHGPVFIIQDNMDLHTKPPVWPVNICEVSEANKDGYFRRRTHAQQKTDAALIVWLRNNAPALIAAQAAEIEQLKEALNKATVGRACTKARAALSNTQPKGE